MARILDQFVGTFRIRYGGGAFDLIQPGYWLSIGTGQYGDPDPDGVKVGIAIINPNRRCRVLPQEGSPPAYAFLVDGTLNGSSYWLDGERLPMLLAFQISLMTLKLPDRGLFRAPSLMVSLGDPQNAGVWAADDESGDEPPPPPIGP